MTARPPKYRLVIACGKEPQALLEGEPRGPSAIYRLDEGDFVRALASRRRYVSLDGLALGSEAAVRGAIAVDGWCWLERQEDR